MMITLKFKLQEIDSAFKELINVFIFVGKSFDALDYFGVDQYLTAVGLAVHPDYRRR